MMKEHRNKIIFLISIFYLALAADGPVIKSGFFKKRAMMKIASYEDRKFSIHNGNKVLTRFYNYGGIGDWTISGRYDSGIYPQGSGRAYIAEFTPVVAASVPRADGRRFHIVSDGMVSNTGKDVSDAGVQWGFDPLSGYANPNQENIAMSDNAATWPEIWPNKSADWDGSWIGQYGKYPRADQESYFVMDDYYNDEFNFYPDANDSLRRGLGIEVEARGYQWAHVAAEDILIWTYLITNKGTTTLDSVVFGMYGDADVGDDGDQRDDDSWFDKDNDIVYQWDHDNWSNAKGGFKPAYFGWKFLESPGNPSDGVDNDGDDMVDESQFNGIDDDGDWNVETDDIGSDGLGPNHQGYTGPDADGTEGNGLPDLGEPNFEITDNDESDQIGLTSFYAAVWPNITASDDEKLWDQMQTGFFSVPEQTVDITFLYGSGYFQLAPGEQKKFAVAMLFGEDQDDILRNAVTMQAIYDADYNFAKPPSKPVLTAVPGDGRVTLYWDESSELSQDPIYGYDFEGYRIYRATDPALLEPWVITDAYGNKTYRKALAQFDIENGLSGLHAEEFNGVHFDMGYDTGLRHFWVDSTVQNGQKYYYAITSYDAGYADDYYENEISVFRDLQPLVPSECPIIVKQSASGEVEYFDVNVVEVTPNAPIAGYVPANTISQDENFFSHDSGHGTGYLEIEVIDPNKVRNNWTYTVEFNNSNTLLYSVQDQNVFTDTVTIITGWGGLSRTNIVPTSVTMTSLSGSQTYLEGTDFTVQSDLGIINSDSTGNLSEGQSYLASYNYYPLANSELIAGEDLNPLFDGILLEVNNQNLALLIDSSGWFAGDCNYIPEIKVSDFGGSLYPADYEIQWLGGVDDSISVDEVFGVSVPFEIWNLTEDIPARFVVMELNGDKRWDPEEGIVILVGDDGMIANYQVNFAQDTSVAANDFGAGDIIRIYTSKSFANDDRFSFTTTIAYEDKTQAKAELDRIAVVPNPYVVAASWEPQHLFISGRGTRKIDFIHLPRECTIKIFTISGYLIDTIQHTSSLEDGSEAWNMLSKDGLEIAYGIYIYHVDAPGIGEKIGKFALIK